MNILSTLSNGNSSKQKVPADGVHRIRVDFKVKAFSDMTVMTFKWKKKKGTSKGIERKLVTTREMSKNYS